jgi:hypothetical protein
MALIQKYFNKYIRYYRPSNPNCYKINCNAIVGNVSRPNIMIRGSSLEKDSRRFL